MVWFRLIAFVVATLALAGCCASGNGCYVPVPGVPTAWDGAGTRPGEDPAPRRQRMARPKTEIIVGSIERASAEAGPLSAAPPSDASAAEKSEADKSRSDRFWAQKDAGEREADARLTRRLMICRDCLPSAVGTGAVGPVR
jgi:hypothetical protein